MRDRIMDEAYFREYIREETERLRRFEYKLENNEVRQDRVYAVQSKVDSIRFRMLIARYSCGEAVAALKPEFLRLLADMPVYWGENSNYVDMVWMMSLAILFNVEKEDFRPLSDLAERYSPGDPLLEFLAQYKLYGKVGSLEGRYSVAAPYEKLAGLPADRDGGVARLKTYLDKHWYAGHKDEGWHDIHKASERLYYGYWSFEAAALVKALALDDTTLRVCAYYPYDLAHFYG